MLRACEKVYIRLRLDCDDCGGGGGVSDESLHVDVDQSRVFLTATAKDIGMIVRDCEISVNTTVVAVVVGQ